VDPTTTDSVLTVVAVGERGNPAPVPDLACAGGADAELRDRPMAERGGELAALTEDLECQD
jgi:acyl-CoA hydrolase